MKNSLLFILFILFLSCQKDKGSKEPIAPELSLTNREVVYKYNEIDPTNKQAYYRFTFDFKDLNGDLGWSEQERKLLFPPVAVIPQIKTPEDVAALEYRKNLNKEYIKLQGTYSNFFSRPSEAFDSINVDYKILKERYDTLMVAYQDIMKMYFYCLLVEYYQYDEQGKAYSPKDINYNSTLPELKGYAGDNTICKGQILFDVNLANRQSDTISFSFILRDKNLLKSQKVETGKIVISN